MGNQDGVGGFSGSGGIRCPIVTIGAEAGPVIDSLRIFWNDPADLLTRPINLDSLKIAMPTPVTQISGIGPSTAELLRASGFRSAEKIASSDAKSLSAVPGFGPVRAQATIAAAKALVGQSSLPSESKGKAKTKAERKTEKAESKSRSRSKSKSKKKSKKKDRKSKKSPKGKSGKGSEKSSKGKGSKKEKSKKKGKKSGKKKRQKKGKKK